MTNTAQTATTPTLTMGQQIGLAFAGFGATIGKFTQAVGNAVKAFVETYEPVIEVSNTKKYVIAAASGLTIGAAVTSSFMGCMIASGLIALLVVLALSKKEDRLMGGLCALAMGLSAPWLFVYGGAMLISGLSFLFDVVGLTWIYASIAIIA